MTARPTSLLLRRAAPAALAANFTVDSLYVVLDPRLRIKAR